MAAALQTYMTNLMLEQGKIPFSQVVTDNKESLGLQQKLGFYLSRDTIFWMEAEKQRI